MVSAAPVPFGNRDNISGSAAAGYYQPGVCVPSFAMAVEA